MTDLLSTVLTLDPLQGGELDPFQGYATHALFLDLTGRVDPGAAHVLHQDAALQPFTSSNLIGLRCQEGKPKAAVEPGAPVRWRITTFEPALTRLWLEKVLPALPPCVTIGDVPFGIKSVATDSVADGWAGVSSYAELTMRHTLTPSPPAPWIKLRFASPTTFRSHDVHVPLPIPQLMLGHWVEKWNAFAPLSLHPGVRGLADQEVAVNRYDLRTEVVQFGGATIIGFVGACSIAVRHDDAYWRRIPQLLAAFSFWCGTGYRTPYGLGQTRPLCPLHGATIDLQTGAVLEPPADEPVKCYRVQVRGNDIEVEI
jgi:CRISPR-associated endoribonuclease Cas6